MRRLTLACVGALLLLYGCASVNPNPNVGMRSTDMMLEKGDCAAARELAEPHANKGEPWAQERMALSFVGKRCPKASTQETLTAMKWLTKAACYQSKSAWERGSDLAVGPAGYFNARASSTNSAMLLSVIYLSVNKPGAAWWFVDHSRSQFGPDEEAYKKLSERLTYIESLIRADDLEKLKAANADLCSPEAPAR